MGQLKHDSNRFFVSSTEFSELIRLTSSLLRRESMKRSLCVLLMVVIVVGCAGRDPRPIETVKPTDKIMTCDDIDMEIMTATNEFNRLTIESDKTARNVALGILGYFLIIPLFFMDFKNAEKHEAEMYRNRITNLRYLQHKNKC